MKKIRLLVLLLASIAIISSCKKGDTGDTGPAGTNGTNGNANVTTTLYTATPGAWTGAATWHFIDIPVPALTNPDHDLVMADVQFDSAGVWVSLPGSNLRNNGDIFRYSYTTGTLSMWYYYPSAPTETWIFKIVVIPPSGGRPALDN
jgi:hypothetical protein